MNTIVIKLSHAEANALAQALDSYEKEPLTSALIETLMLAALLGKAPSKGGHDEAESKSMMRQQAVEPIRQHLAAAMKAPDPVLHPKYETGTTLHPS